MKVLEFKCPCGCGKTLTLQEGRSTYHILYSFFEKNKVKLPKGVKKEINRDSPKEGV